MFSSHLKPGSSLFSPTGLAGSQAFALLGKTVRPFPFTSTVNSTSLKELKEQAGLQVTVFDHREGGKASSSFRANWPFQSFSTPPQLHPNAPGTVTWPR